jgi:hypothetical protein
MKNRYPHIELELTKYYSLRWSFCHTIIRALEKYISLSHNLPLKPIDNKAIGGLQKMILRCKVELNGIYSKELLSFIKSTFELAETTPNPAIQLPLYKLLSWTATKN